MIGGIILALLFILSGIVHLVSPQLYLRIVPPYLPAHLPIVYISGVAEILGALGLILPQTRRLAAWGLVALYIAVFPANLNMALNDLPLGTTHVASWMLWARLPLQLVLIVWAFWYARRD